MLKFLRTADLPTRMLLIAALAVGSVLTLLHVLFSVDIYRDSANVYSAMARALVNGDLAEAFHPSIPALNVLLSWGFSAIGMRPEQAMSLVSGLFYVATIPVLFLLLKEFLPERWSAIGVLLFAAAPKIIRFSCTSLIDSGKIFFVVAALLMLCKLISSRFQSRYLALGFGIALGGMSLARSEGIGNAGILALGAAVYYICMSIEEKKLLPISSALIALTAWVVALLGRMTLMYFTVGEFVYDRRLATGFANIWKHLTDTRPVLTDIVVAPQAIATRVSWFYLFNQNIRGCYEAYLIFFLAGVIFLILSPRFKQLWPEKMERPELRWHNFYWILLAMVLGNALIFKASGIAAYRYFIINIPLLMVFTVIGLFWVFSWVGKFIPKMIVVGAFVAILVVQVLNGADYFFSRKSQISYADGKRIEKVCQSSGRHAPKVWFNNASVEWYYSNTRRAWPIESCVPDTKTFADFDYVVWAKKESGIDELVARKDLREIPMSKESRVRLFEKIK